MDKIEVFNIGALYFTLDGQGVMTSDPTNNLKLCEDYITEQKPKARALSVLPEAFTALQSAARGESKYSINHVLNSYFRIE